MITTVSITAATLEEALATSRNITPSVLQPGLRADLDATLEGYLISAWDAIERTVRDAFMRGRDGAQLAWEDCQQKLAQLLERAGAQAKKLHALVLERLRTLLRELISHALSLVPDTLQIGSRALIVDGINCTQKLTLGGKLEVNVAKLCELVAEGEIEIEVSYRAPSAQK